MLFLDLLDSAKSAYGGEENIDWWRPQPDSREKAIALAEAAVMSRLLMGQSIRASNPQLMDSVALLQMAPRFLNLKGADFAPLIAVFHGKGKYLPAAPGSLVQVAQEYFEDYSKNTDFITSAWFPINHQQAEVVARNLRTNENEKTRFSRMLRGIRIDSEYRAVLNDQAENLQFLYNYLNKARAPFSTCETDEKAVKWFSERPNVLPSVWGYLEEIKDHEQDGEGWGIHGEYLERMEEIVRQIAKEKKVDINRLKESRSVLYNALGQVVETPEEREWIQRHIDFVYNIKVSSTVSGGDGLFTMSDVTLPIDISGVVDQLSMSGNLQKNFISNQNVEIEILSLSPDIDVPVISWDHINEIWKSPDYRKKVRSLQQKRSMLSQAYKDGVAEEIANEQDKTQNAINDLQASLKVNLGEIFAKDYQERGLVKFTFDVAKSSANLPGFIVAAFLEKIPGLPLPLAISAKEGVDAIIKPHVERLVQQQGERILQAYAAGRVQDWLDAWSPINNDFEDQ